MATLLEQTRALIPDRDIADQIFSDDDLNIYLELADDDPMRAAGLALGAASTEHARVESYRKTQGLTVDGKDAAALMFKRSEKLLEMADDNDEGSFVIVEYPPAVDYSQ